MSGKTWRSEPFRRAVAALPCQRCGIEGATQAAHRNETKGIGIKTSDALTCALCHECHSLLDQSPHLAREERRDLWNRAYVKTMQALIESGRLVLA